MWPLFLIATTVSKMASIKYTIFSEILNQTIFAAEFCLRILKQNSELFNTSGTGRRNSLKFCQTEKKTEKGGLCGHRHNTKYASLQFI